MAQFRFTVPHHARSLVSRRIWRRRIVFWGGALLVGGVSALLTLAADWAQSAFETMRHAFWALPLLITPFGFVFCAWLTRRYFPGAQGSGIPQAIAARHLPSLAERQTLLSPRLLTGKLILTVAGLLCGASVGREGPTVQLGAGIMLQVARLGGAGTERGLILAGSAAGIAAAFNAPLAGIVFAIEEMSRSFQSRTNGLVLYAVIIAGLVSLGLFGDYTYFGTSTAAVTSARDWVLVAVCGVIGGLIGGIFSRALLEITSLIAKFLARQKPLHALIWPLACGVLVALLGLLSHGESFGTGYAQARSLVEGQPLPFLFWPEKFFATLATALSGLPGGIFAPSLAVGAGLGGWLAGIGGASISLGAVLGMAGYFTGVVQAPMTAFVILLEMTGDNDAIIPLMVTAMLGFGASKLVCPRPLYHSLARGFLAASHPPKQSPAPDTPT